MSVRQDNLGRLIGIYGMSAAHVQRAVFIVVLSFLFFVAMMFAYYALQNLIYFLLASAFLAVYLVTLFSFISQKRNMLRLYEQGFEFRKSAYRWDEIGSVEWTSLDRSRILQVTSSDGRALSIPGSLNDIDALVKILKSKSNLS